MFQGGSKGRFNGLQGVSGRFQRRFEGFLGSFKGSLGGVSRGCNAFKKILGVSGVP